VEDEQDRKMREIRKNGKRKGHLREKMDLRMTHSDDNGGCSPTKAGEKWASVAKSLSIVNGKRTSPFSLLLLLSSDEMRNGRRGRVLEGE